MRYRKVRFLCYFSYFETNTSNLIYSHQIDTISYFSRWTVLAGVDGADGADGVAGGGESGRWCMFQQSHGYVLTFSTLKVTSGGKVCTMIIDGGSCENVVLTTMDKKLGLKTEDHPQSYKLSWLNKGNNVKVRKRFLAQFSIGKKYTDEVWCDVVPMDAFHILLDRP